MKKWASLLLAFTLCLSLTVPTMAAGADGLTSAEAKAYLNELNKINATIQYAGLMDMDKNGKPELVAVTLTNPDEYSYDHYDTAEVYIWTVKNGSAVKAAKESFQGSTFADICANTASSGQIYIHYVVAAMRPGIHAVSDSILNVSGQVDLLIADYGYNGDEENYFRNGFEDDHAVTKKEYTQLQEKYGGTGSEYTPSYAVKSVLLASSAGRSWIYDMDTTDSVQETRTQLSKKVNSSVSVPAAGTYGEYTIILDYATVTFKSAKVEKKPIKFAVYLDEGEIGEIGTETVTVITVKPGSYINIIGNPYMGYGYEDVGIWDGNKYIYGWATGEPGTVAGNNYFVMSEIGAVEPMLIDGVAEKSFQYPNTVYHIYSDIYVLLGNTVGDFLDVSADEYYAKPVEWAVKKKITSGTSATTFSPNSTCTNAQILTFLWKANGSPAPTISNPFSNVKTSDYYYKPALWAYQNGMVSGKTFNSNAPCTRSQTVMYMWQSAGKPTTKNTVSFTDVSGNASYAKAVAWAVKEGITAGTSATTFSPNSTCTRGQIVTFLYNYFG